MDRPFGFSAEESQGLKRYPEGEDYLDIASTAVPLALPRTCQKHHVCRRELRIAHPHCLQRLEEERQQQEEFETPKTTPLNRTKCKGTTLVAMVLPATCPIWEVKAVPLYLSAWIPRFGGDSASEKTSSRPAVIQEGGGEIQPTKVTDSASRIVRPH